MLQFIWEYLIDTECSVVRNAKSFCEDYFIPVVEQYHHFVL
jgi:hypothetical protein